MSRRPHEEASRNPFMPPPNRLTVSWPPQNITFNVLFNIMDHHHHHERPSDSEGHGSSSSDLWPISQQESWTEDNTDSNLNLNQELPSDRHQLIDRQVELDIPLESIGQILDLHPPRHLLHPNLDLLSSSCGMCLEGYLPPNHLVVLLPCHPSHFFHRDCIRNWFREYLTCPLCRRDFNQP